jgi:hypothetical protein
MSFRRFMRLVTPRGGLLWAIRQQLRFLATLTYRRPAR